MTLAGACDDKKVEKPAGPEQDEPGRRKAKPCCDQPKIPEGVPPFLVLADDQEGPREARRVNIKATLMRMPERADSLYRPLHILYRHAMERGEHEPAALSVRMYDTAKNAQSGAKPIARLDFSPGAEAPRCQLYMAPSYAELAENAFTDIFSDTASPGDQDSCRLRATTETETTGSTNGAKAAAGEARKPKVSIDADKQAMAVTYPYPEDARLSYIETLEDWARKTVKLFDRNPYLQRFTFVGTHRGKEIVRLSTTRDAYNRQLVPLLQRLTSLQRDQDAPASGRKARRGRRRPMPAARAKRRAIAQVLRALPKEDISVSRRLR